MGETAQALKGSMSPSEIDVWKALFVQNCLDIFGAPTDIRHCLSTDEKYYFSYCSVCLALAMKEHEGVWKSYIEGFDPEEAAYLFARHYNESNNEDLIPLYKFTDTGKGQK